MKRKIVAGVLLLLIAGFAFAQSADIGGAYGMKLGVDLDTGYFGIKNGFEDFKITVTQPVNINPNFSENMFYGELAVAGLRLEANSEMDHEDEGLDNTENIAITNSNWDWDPGVDIDFQVVWDAITAKLFLGPVTVQLFFNGGLNQITKNYSNNWVNLLENAYKYMLFEGQYGASEKSEQLAYGWTNDDKKYFRPIALGNNYFNTPHGFTADWAIDRIGTVRFVANTMDMDWGPTEDTENNNGDLPDNENNAFSILGGFLLTAIPNVNIDFAVAQGFNSEDMDYTDMGIAAEFSFSINDLFMQPILSSDMYFDDGDFAYAFTGGLKTSFMGSKLTAYLSSDDFNNISDSVYTVALDMASVPGLTLQGALEKSSRWMGIHAKTGYDFALNEEVTLTPSTQFSMDNQRLEYNTPGVDGFEYYAKAELLLSGLVGNTDFLLNWDSNDLTNDENIFGQLVFTTKINF